MKKTKLGLWAIATVTAGLFAFTDLVTGSVKGTINPVDGGLRAWAVSGTDTFKSNITQGTFEIGNVKPGTYRVIIEANAPYKNYAKDGVTVSDGSAIDLGEIKLEK